MSNSHSLSVTVMPARAGGLAEDKGHLSFLELEAKSPLRKIEKGKDEEENKSAHLTCSALWEEQ